MKVLYELAKFMKCEVEASPKPSPSLSQLGHAIRVSWERSQSFDQGHGSWHINSAEAMEKVKKILSFGILIFSKIRSRVRRFPNMSDSCARMLYAL